MEYERTESFEANMEALNDKAAALDVYLRDLATYIQRADAAKQADESRWAMDEAAWEEEARLFRERFPEEVERAMSAADREAAYWDTSSRARNLLYSAWFEDSDEDGEAGISSGDEARQTKHRQVQCILATKSFNGETYHQVKWRGVSLVTWESEEDLKRTERLRPALSCDRKKGRLRPCLYIPQRRIKNRPPPQRAGGTQYPSLWACEVERNIWIPYEPAAQEALNASYRLRAATCAITVGGATYTVDFATMRQKSESRSRAVQRIEQIPIEVIREELATMSLDDLRTYLSTVTDFTPAHYEALSRLHDLDKVHSHLTHQEIGALPVLSFGQVLENICSGGSYPGLTEECCICLENYEPDDRLNVMPACGHIFHRRCAVDYFSKYSKLCPYCKESVV